MTPLFTTVGQPAASRDIVSLDDLREQLQIKPNDTGNDAWLSKVIVRCSKQAERYCNRIFVQQGYVDTFCGGVAAPQREPLILSQAPVDPSTISVVVDGVALAPATDFGLDQFAGLVYRLTETMSWQSSASLVVTYTGGFAEIPDDVQQAVLDLCTMDNSGRGRDPMLRAQESPGIGRREYWIGGMPGGVPIPQDIAGLLAPYQRGNIG